MRILRGKAYLFISLASLVEDHFIREFFSEKTNTPMAWRHKCKKHWLPPECSRLMKPGERPWPALSEDNIDKASAAWSWLHKFYELRAQENPVRVKIGDGRFSKFVQPCTIVRHKGEDEVFAAMGNFLWAALGMPLASVEMNGQKYWKFKRAHVKFIHIFDPSSWVALPFVETRLAGHGLVMQQQGTDAGVPLIVHTLRQGFHMRLGQPHQI